MRPEELLKKIEHGQDEETSFSQRITRPEEVPVQQEDRLSKTAQGGEPVISSEEAAKIREAREQAGRIYDTPGQEWKYPGIPEYVDEDEFENVYLGIPPLSHLETWETEYLQSELDALRLLFEAFKAKLHKENPERYQDIASGQHGRLIDRDYYDANTFEKFKKKIEAYEQVIAKRQRSFSGRLKKFFGGNT